MTATLFQPDRRAALRLLLGTAASISTAIPTIAQPAPTPPLAPAFPDGAQITVAGPEGGELDDWARILVPAIGGFLPPNSNLRRAMAGGTDGVTGANQFTAQALPDGASALLAPGAAMLAWLRGDARVQFDPTRWTSLMLGHCPSLLAGRIGPAQLVAGQKLRVGVSGPNGPEIAALLGLELLGLQPIAVPGLMDPAAVSQAYAQHAIDVVMVRDTIATRARSDLRPICVLGRLDEKGDLTRDPAQPDLPHLGELLSGLPTGHLTAAWRATAVAAQLLFGLMLPPLTAAAQIALWRHAVAQAARTPEVVALANAQAARLQAGPDTALPIAPDADALGALRSWLAARQRR